MLLDGLDWDGRFGCVVEKDDACEAEDLLRRAANSRCRSKISFSLFVDIVSWEIFLFHNMYDSRDFPFLVQLHRG
jgi:hypothetical protein